MRFSVYLKIYMNQKRYKKGLINLYQNGAVSLEKRGWIIFKFDSEYYSNLNYDEQNLNLLKAKKI